MTITSKDSLIKKIFFYGSFILIGCGIYRIFLSSIGTSPQIDYLGWGFFLLGLTPLIYLSALFIKANDNAHLDTFLIEDLAIPGAIVSKEGVILKTNNCFNSLLDFDLGIENKLSDFLENFDGQKGLEDLAVRAPQLFSVKTAHNDVMPYVVSAEPLEECYLILFHPQASQKQGNDQSGYETPFARALDLKYLFNQAPAANLVLDDQETIQVGNRNFFANVLKSQDQTPGAPFAQFLKQASKEAFRVAIAELKHKHVLHSVCELEFENGVLAYAYIRPLDFKDPYTQDAFSGYFIQMFDNSEQKNMQTRLLHTQKLQALGQLAGGIAHDFNNLLTAMIGFCDLLLMRISPGDQSFTDIMQIKQNANRATNLVRQLLAFSRQQTLQPKVLDVAETLSDLSLLLQRLIGSNIELDIVYDRGADFIKVDRGQFEQVIVNLVVNAKDALKGEGVIRITTALEDHQEAYFFDHEMVPVGKYVKLVISDNGCGIKKEHLARIFDPFFSTKVLGEGAGLGLSTVYGIVKQTGGYISVESKEGYGTKFTVLIPHHDAGQHPIETERLTQSDDSLTSFEDLTGQETILLAEDEDAVRLFAARALSDKGYSVQQAQNGLEALEYLSLLKEKGEPSPKLLITDVVMPKMDGPTLVREAMKIYPDMKVLFISGYAEDAFRDSVSLDEEIQFLSKPFSLKLLARRVRELLNQTKRPKIENSDSENKLVREA